jgi:cephalosporin-C deacetylase-like acetyl esterase
MPEKSATGRTAAKVMFHGYGTDQAIPAYNTGMITLSVNPVPEKHDGKNGDLIKKGGKLYYYHYWGIDDLQKNFFPGMFKRAYRALQFVKMLPEWDQRTLIVQGSSQGGGQALAAAGLDPQVSLCVALVPALCNHGGFDIGAESGWPRYHWQERDYKDDPEKVLNVLDYIDCCFFASKITNAEVIMSAGFLDQTCVPSSVYSAYNVIPSGKKQIFNDLKMPHRIAPETMKKINFLINDHITRMQADFN